MNRSTVSTCHCLKIIPISQLSRFARLQSKVIMMAVDDPIDIKAVPGSIKISTTESDSRVKKKITFERAGVSETTADILEGYKALRLVATYIDESGRERVAGSPDWPLSLDFTTEDGVFSISLQGEDTRPDGFLTD